MIKIMIVIILLIVVIVVIIVVIVAIIVVIVGMHLLGQNSLTRNPSFSVRAVRSVRSVRPFRSGAFRPRDVPVRPQLVL